MRYLNDRKPSMADVLRDWMTERTQTLRSAATYGSLEIWPGAPLTVCASIYQPGVVVVTLLGEASDITSPLIGRVVTEQLPGAPRRFIVDLSHVTLLSFAAVGELLEAQVYGETRNFDVTLVAPSGAAIHALEMSRNAGRFAIHSTIESALPV